MTHSCAVPGRQQFRIEMSRGCCQTTCNENRRLTKGWFSANDRLEGISLSVAASMIRKPNVQCAGTTCGAPPMLFRTTCRAGKASATRNGNPTAPANSSASNLLAMASNLVASLLLEAVPFVPSSVLAPSSKARSP